MGNRWGDSRNSVRLYFFRRIRDPVKSLGQEDPLEEEMATHSGIHVWRMPWMEEPGRLWSIGSQRVGHDSFLACMHV